MCVCVHAFQMSCDMRQPEAYSWENSLFFHSLWQPVQGGRQGTKSGQFQSALHLRSLHIIIFPARKVSYQLCQAGTPTCSFKWKQKTICNCTGCSNSVYPQAKCSHLTNQCKFSWKKKKKLTESNAHRPSFCCVQIKRHVWNIAAALKLGVYGRKGSCQSPKHGCHVGTLSQDSTLWQGSNKYCLPIPAYSATPKDTPAPTAIHTGEGQEFQLQEFVSSQSVLLHGHQQCTLALYAQHHDAITDAIGTMNLSWSQYPRHAGFAAHIKLSHECWLCCH